MNLALRHFDITEWADYVRKLSSPEQMREMDVHLQDGCVKCNKTLGLLARFATICLREGAYEVPRDAEQRVKALATRDKAPNRPLLERIWASLVYDGLSNPQPVGVRGGHQIDRHSLFYAGDYSVDLRFEHEKGSVNMVLVGQIANQKAPDDVIANVLVMLVAGSVAGSRELARSMSNSFGEFQMEYIPEKDLRLLVPLESRGLELEVQLGKVQQI